MKKGIVNVAKTINLSKLKACERPQTVQKLVGADVMESCPKTGQGTQSYFKPTPVTIKVCSRKDMERTCPPKLCDCSEEMGTLESKKSRIMNWVTFVLKSSVVAGLIYWTAAEGVWGDSDQTEDLYYRILSTIAPALPNIPDIDELPHVDNMKYSVSEMYNRGVVKIISALVAVPLAIQNGIANVLFPCATEKDDQNQKELKGEA